VVGNEVRVEKGPGRPEPEESRGGGGLAALLVDVDEGLVDGAGKRNLNRITFFRVQKVTEVTPGRVKEALESQLSERVRQLERLLDLELRQLDVEVVNLVEARAHLGHDAAKCCRIQTLDSFKECVVVEGRQDDHHGDVLADVGELHNVSAEFFGRIIVEFALLLHEFGHSDLNQN